MKNTDSFDRLLAGLEIISRALDVESWRMTKSTLIVEGTERSMEAHDRATLRSMLSHFGWLCLPTDVWIFSIEHNRGGEDTPPQKRLYQLLMFEAPMIGGKFIASPSELIRAFAPEATRIQSVSIFDCFVFEADYRENVPSHIRLVPVAQERDVRRFAYGEEPSRRDADPEPAKYRVGEVEIPNIVLKK